MNREKIDEYKSRISLYDDDAKPLAGSMGQYTRLAVVGLRPEKGVERHFTLFAESTKLFDAIARANNTPDWVHEGFDQKWLYIEEVLRRPGSSDDISGYLQKVMDDDLWTGLFEYLKSTGIMDRFTKAIKAKSYGLPYEQQAGIGLPNNLNPKTKFIVPKKKGE